MTRETDPSSLAPGDAHYMAYVGPPQQYDFMGATQFSLLFALGLRANDRLLDFGCGSLRAGRLLIVYLDPDRYFGVEPNQWLIEDAISKQIGWDLLRIKRPTFDHNDRFDAGVFGGQFDFIVAQSVFSHAGPTEIERSLSGFRDALGPAGIIVATFKEGADDPTEPPPWTYPGVVAYPRRTIAGFARRAGLAALRIPWFHPRQTWYLMALDRDRLPDRSSLRDLRGTVLDR